MVVLVGILAFVSGVTGWEFALRGAPIPSGGFAAIGFLSGAAVLGGMALFLDRWPRIVAAAKKNRAIAGVVIVALLALLGYGISELRFLNQGGRLNYAAHHGDLEMLAGQLERDFPQDRLDRAMRKAFYAGHGEAFFMVVEAGGNADGFFAEPWMDEGAWAAAERNNADERMFEVLTELGYGDPKSALE